VKIFVNRENSGWIFDRIHADYVKTTRHQVVGINDNPDVCWFLNPWGFANYATSLKCPAFIHVHHIDEEKISQWRFDVIDKYATGCIVPNKHTEVMLKKIVAVPVYRFPYWLISDITAPRCTPDPNEDVGLTLIGSFQKDSEGNTNKPKLSKGPDIFLEVLSKIKDKYSLKVILTGYNRRYMIEGLNKLGILFEYHENADDLNSLYDRLDWYFVTSRIEGGPQAILEASYRNIKILSTNVGIASEVLHPDCICKDVDGFVNKFENNIDRTKENKNNVMINFGRSLIVDRLDGFFEKCINK